MDRTGAKYCVWAKCPGRANTGHPIRLIGHRSKANFLKGKGVTREVRRQG